MNTLHENLINRVVKETEKAIMFRVMGTTAAFGGDTVSYNMWVPKSLITKEGLIPEWFVNKKKDELNLLTITAL